MSEDEENEEGTFETDLWLAGLYTRTGRPKDAIRSYAEALVKAPEGELDPAREMAKVAATLDDEGARTASAELAAIVPEVDEHRLRDIVLAFIDGVEAEFAARTLALAARHQKRTRAIALLLAASYAEDPRIRYAASGVLERKAATVPEVLARLQVMADRDASEKVRDLLKEFKTTDVDIGADSEPVEYDESQDIIIFADDEDELFLQE